MKKFAVCLFIATFIFCFKSESQDTDPIKSLAKGVNLTNWFNDYSDPSQFSNRFSYKTLQLIYASGFTYVRIPVGPLILFNAKKPEQLNTKNLLLLDAAVQNCIDAGLAVTINLHPLSATTDSLLAADTGFFRKIATYWQAVASWFKKYPADKIFFEILNEPHASAAGLTKKDFSWWQAAQEKILKSIHEAAPEHFVIAGGEGYNSIEGLLKLKPYKDPKVIYDFHFYEPFFFTHQGAVWAGWQGSIEARNVPFPSSPQVIAPLQAGSISEPLRLGLYSYGENRYNTDSLDKWIKRAFDWGIKNHVKVIANEFGSYKEYAPKQSRLRWLHDVRSIFEKYGINWCMWDCDEGFGFIDYPDGNRSNPVPDEDILRALGLKSK